MIYNFTKLIGSTNMIKPQVLREIFSKIIQAIEDEDPDKLGQILGESINELDLPILQDEKGNTIYHYLILAANFELMRASSTYEVGFSRSMGLKNNEGKTPFQCIDDLPEEKALFKIKAKQKLGPSWQQGYILNQFRNFLSYQIETDPMQYKKEDVMWIMDVFRKGHCNGFAVLWMQFWFDDPHHQHGYYQLFKNIVYWDKSKESLTNELIKQFEYAISLVRAHQMDPGTLEAELKEFAHQKAKWQEQNPSREALELFLQAPDFYINNQEWHKFYNSKQFRKEQHYNQSLNKQELAQFLRRLARPENEGKGLNLRQALIHSIAAGYSEGKLTIFDSNYSMCLSTELQAIAKTFDLTTDEGAMEAANEIFFIFNESFGKKNVTSLEFLQINLFGRTNSLMGHYPNMDEVKGEALYKQIVENKFKNIRAIDFVLNFPFFEKILEKNALTDLLKKIEFKKDTINEIFENQETWEDFTPLSYALTKFENEELISTLLAQQADPFLDIYGITPLNLAEEQGKNNFVALLKNYKKPLDEEASSPKTGITSHHLFYPPKEEEIAAPPPLTSKQNK